MINTIENKNVNIFTSNFKISGKNPNVVSIAQGKPPYYRGREYRDLAPSWSLIKRFKNGDINAAGYEIEYRRDVLGKLDPVKVIEELGPNAVLLCWCKPDEFCHRRIVGSWLEEALGIKVPEYVPVPLTAIYTPTGAALEYANLGLNPYVGCSHKCSYCYNKKHANISCDKRNSKFTLKNIKEDLEALIIWNNQDPAHLTFVGDPYDLGRQDNSYIREVLQLFRKYDHPFQVLTKGGSKAVQDFDLYGPADKFGVTLTLDNAEDSKKFEPGAALPDDRIEALRIAHERGIETWVSLEPVLDPDQTLHLIDLTHEFVDFYGVGKMNHEVEIEKTIDWPKFRADAEAKLKGYGKSYKIKAALKAAT